MKRKETFDYFTELSRILQEEKQAVEQLYELVDKYTISRIATCKERIGEQKKRVNVKKNDLILYLWKDFLPPMERGDLINYINQLSNVIYSLSNIVLTIENYPVSFMKGNIVNVVISMEVVLDSADQMVKELKNYKKSKLLKKRIEECREKAWEGMNAYQKGVRQVARNAEVTKEFFGWIKIYDAMYLFFDRMLEVIDLTEVILYRNC